MTEKKSDKKDDIVKTGPPVDDRVDDGRKDDDGSAGPRPHGAKQGDAIEELESRQKFLSDNPVHLEKKK